MISYATQPGNVALDGASGNSPFTTALAATMRKPGLDIFQTFNEVGVIVKRSTGGAQQPWVSSSPIDGSFYFNSSPASPSAAVTPSQADRSSEAEPAWRLTKDTTSQAVLEDFIRQFGTTVYGSMARARLDELKRERVALVAPPPQAPPPSTQQPRFPFRLWERSRHCWASSATGAHTRPSRTIQGSATRSRGLRGPVPPTARGIRLTPW